MDFWNVPFLCPLFPGGLWRRRRQRVKSFIFWWTDRSSATAAFAHVIRWHNLDTWCCCFFFVFFSFFFFIFFFCFNVITMAGRSVRRGHDSAVEKHLLEMWVTLPTAVWFLLGLTHTFKLLAPLPVCVCARARPVFLSPWPHFYDRDFPFCLGNIWLIFVDFRIAFFYFIVIYLRAQNSEVGMSF